MLDKNNKQLGVRDGSVTKNTCGSSEDPSVVPEHLLGSSQLDQWVLGLCPFVGQLTLSHRVT